MTRKKWWAAALILGILAIAFFWGGNQPSSKQSASSSDAMPVLAEQTVSPDELEMTKEAAALTEPDMLPASPQTDEPDDAADHSDSLNAGEAAPAEVTAPPVPSSPAAEPEIIESAPAAERDKGAFERPKAAEPPSSLKPEAGESAPAGQPIDEESAIAPSEEKPEPVEWQEATVEKDRELSITLSVSAETILNNLDLLNEDKLEVLPEDGIIFEAQQVTFYEGETVFDVLVREMKNHKIHLEFEMTPLYNSHYIEGINNLYEFDCGELSGWMYKVNGWFPNYGSSRYALKDGDVVEWVYTCDLGRDVGGYIEGVESGGS